MAIVIKNEGHLKDLLKDGNPKHITLESKWSEIETTVQYNKTYPNKIMVVMFNYQSGNIETINTFAGFAAYFNHFKKHGWKLVYQD